MIRSQLVARIAELNPQLYAKEIEAVVDAVLGRITVALMADDRVELRDFGSFALRHRMPRDGRNPRNGDFVAVGARAGVYFKPSKAMRARLNLKAESVDPEQDAERTLQMS